MIKGPSNMNRRPRNVVMGLWHVNRGPWSVIRGSVM